MHRWPPSSRCAALACALALAACDEETPKVAFEDVTAKAGLPTSSSRCISLRDFTRDGRLDVLVAPLSEDGLSRENLQLHVGRGDGTFLTREFPFSIGRGSCAVADFDGDGRLDLAAVRSKTSPLQLLRGVDSTILGFEDVSELLPAFDGSIEPVSWVDFDNDGWLDLYVGFYTEDEFELTCRSSDVDAYCHATPPYSLQPLLLRNVEGRAFEPVRLPEQAQALSAMFVDWDGDAWRDLFLAFEFRANGFYRNVEGRSFEPFASFAPALVPNHGMGMEVADFDGDGDWEVAVADLGPSQLWSMDADGRFVDRAHATTFGPGTRLHSNWTPYAADFDLDGHVDLFVPTSATTSTARELELVQTDTISARGPQWDNLFLNDGNGNFERVPVMHRRNGGGSATFAAIGVGDFDEDGMLDALVAAQTSAPELRLLRNVTPRGDHHWLSVTLSQPGPNHEAIGATVTAWDGARQLARVAVGRHGHGSSAPFAHFGLGALTRVTKLEIVWPDGARQVEEGPIAPDRALRIERR